jgi:type II secretory pathway pseudopilin PulG
MKKKQSKHSGISLIEMIVFISVIGIVAVGILNTFSAALIESAKSQNVFIGYGLAMQRMEIILGQRRIVGHQSDPTQYDICASSPPAVCGTTPSGYTVSATLVNNGDTQDITVTVGGSANYSLSMQVSNAS